MRILIELFQDISKAQHFSKEHILIPQEDSYQGVIKDIKHI